MSSATPSRSLKRLSLLQSSTSQSLPFSPNSSNKNSEIASIRDSSSEVPQAGSPVGAETFSGCSLASPTSRSPASSSKKSRRQSSIYYVSQARDGHITGENEHPSQSKRSSLVQDTNISSTSSELKDEVAQCTKTPEEAPKTPILTLAEKHADLLRFIAQKEAKCLDLRSQLAMHEAELLTLKRKWERIVSRGYGSGPMSSVSSLDADASSQGAVISGLKEGVQEVGRILMQLGDLGATHPPDLGHGSNSSISTTSDSTYSSRLSQSSFSSIGLLEEINEERDTKQEDKKLIDSKLKRHSLSTPIRRRPYEPSSPSTPSPSVSSPRTPVSATGAFVTPSSSFKSPRMASTNKKDSHTRHQKRASLSQGSFPPISSIPGVNVAPLASWVGGVGRRLGQLQNSHASSSVSSSSNNTAQTSLLPKRASTLLSDASHSFFAALGSSAITQSPSDTNRTPSPQSLLDDDDFLGSDIQCTSMVSLSPERVKPRPTPIQTSAPPAMIKQDVKILTGSDADSEEWNW